MMQRHEMHNVNQPHKTNPLIWGALLIVAGLLLFLQNLGVFTAVTAFIWFAVFAVGGLVFLYGFLSRSDSMWWAAIPGCTLLGLAGAVLFSDFMPDRFDFLSGPVFLGSIGFGFVLVYLVQRVAWWAIIPAGVMGTLAVVAAVEESGLDVSDTLTGSLFFVGLGVTFLIVALLPGEQRQRRWAFIPAAVLVVMGFLIGTPFVAALGYLWPIALVVGGAVLVWQALSAARRPDAGITAEKDGTEADERELR